MAMSLRFADVADIPDIVALINRAYRPDADHGGWTHESVLICGPRVSEDQVRALLVPGSAVLMLCSANRRPLACVHVQHAPDGAYIGLLATEPSSQGTGLGKRMLEHAERHARDHLGCAQAHISVVALRHELVAFYERRGYVFTGRFEEYPVHAGVGRPLVDGLRLAHMFKDIPVQAQSPG